MSTIASTLLDFMLDLFRDPQKAAAYEADPQGALDAAGLSGSTPADVADLAPMVSDYATVGGWSGGGSHGGGSHGGGSHGGGSHGGGRDDRASGEDGRGGSCDADEDRGGHHSRPVDDDADDRSSGGSVVAPDREEGDDEDEGQAGGGHSHAPAPAGGTETVVITHLHEVHHTHTETTVEIDASHSIWVSGDAQAIFGDVRGDVTQIDNEGGIVAGDDVEDSSVDNSDRSVSDSYNTEVDVDIADSNVNVGGDQAVDSFDTEVEVRDNALVVGDDNTVVSGNGNAVGNTVVTDNSETDNSVDVEFDDAIVQTGDGTVVNDSEDVGNTETTVEDNNLVFAGDDAIVDSEVSDSQDEDNDGIDDSIVGSGNGSDFSDDDVNVEDNEVAIGGQNANTGYQEESGNEDSSSEFEFEVDYEESTAIEADDGAEVEVG
ncbi:IniB N-terminal domain-containing protein [Geodermatophilus sp. URMC 65]